MHSRRCALLFDTVPVVSSVFTLTAAQPVLVHRFGVAHQTSLQSLRTMMSYSNSLPFREAGSLISFAVTASQDYDPLLASPHGHHRSSAAFGRGGRILRNRSGRAT